MYIHVRHKKTSYKAVEPQSTLSTCKIKANLKYSDDGPQQSVKVFAVRNSVAILCLKAEFTAKQMHTQDTAQNNKIQLARICH